MQREYPDLLSVKAFNLASDTPLHEALLSFIKHTFSLEMEDERLILTPPY